MINIGIAASTTGSVPTNTRYLVETYLDPRRNTQVFKSEDGLHSHYKQSQDHHFCSECEEDFDDEDELWDHSEEVHHGCRDCDECDLDFESHEALRQHYIQSQNHHFCKECDRHFKFEESRRQHMDDKHWYCSQHDRVSTR